MHFSSNKFNFCFFLTFLNFIFFLFFILILFINLPWIWLIECFSLIIVLIFFNCYSLNHSVVSGYLHFHRDSPVCISLPFRLRLAFLIFHLYIYHIVFPVSIHYTVALLFLLHDLLTTLAPLAIIL